MTCTFIILAGGRGTLVSRVVGDLHKALLPLDGRAVLSYLIELAPYDAEIVISTGDRAEQLHDYVTLAHPSYRNRITFCHADDWDKVGAGPGTGLLACMEAVRPGNDLIFTSCDTLWRADTAMWNESGSWVGVAALPAGTAPERWCRVATADRNRVVRVLDKVAGDASSVYVGLARIAAEDVEDFWDGVLDGGRSAGEHQVSGGFEALIGRLSARHVPDWMDVGDESSYRNAVARTSGYDWTKMGQATYVLPEEMRVVKYASNRSMITNRATRVVRLGELVPKVVGLRGNMLAYRYVGGNTVYDELNRDPDIHHELMAWFAHCIWRRRQHVTDDLQAREHVAAAAYRFYHGKTMDRIEQIQYRRYRDRAYDIASRVDWDQLIQGTRPGIWHGDLNYGNIIVRRIWTGLRNTSRDRWSRFVGIDWREDFAGIVDWGDLRYDLAKLLAGTVVHWDNARRGDFTVWNYGQRFADEIRAFARSAGQLRDIEIIGALSLLNSAPLHAAPLDEILIARGCAWLEEVL